MDIAAHIASSEAKEWPLPNWAQNKYSTQQDPIWKEFWQTSLVYETDFNAIHSGNGRLNFGERGFYSSLLWFYPVPVNMQVTQQSNILILRWLYSYGNSIVRRFCAHYSPEVCSALISPSIWLFLVFVLFFSVFINMHNI